MNHSFDKVVWQEGMFLSPQHFQQQERYLEHHSRQLFALQHPGLAGFTSLRIDTEQLKAGKLFLREACGMFPDGTPFQLTDNLIRNIDSANAGATIYLALPLLRSARVDTATTEHLSGSIRHKSFDRTVRDCTNHDNDAVELELCLLNPGLMLDGEPLDDYTTLAVARIQEFSSDGELVLDSALLRCQIEDRTLFNDGRFILGVSSSLGLPGTRSTFASAAKLCGHNRIAERVRNALSAVPLNALATAPIELRIQPNTVYFEIDTSDTLWQEMVKTRDKVALHIDEQMPEDTTVECFVIR